MIANRQIELKEIISIVEVIQNKENENINILFQVAKGQNLQVNELEINLLYIVK